MIYYDDMMHYNDMKWYQYPYQYDSQYKYLYDYILTQILVPIYYILLA